MNPEQVAAVQADIADAGRRITDRPGVVGFIGVAFIEHDGRQLMLLPGIVKFSHLADGDLLEGAAETLFTALLDCENGLPYLTNDPRLAET